MRKEDHSILQDKAGNIALVSEPGVAHASPSKDYMLGDTASIKRRRQRAGLAIAQGTYEATAHLA